MMADRIGQQLGNYRLVRLLGQGGFADVYLGEHIYLKTEAAIKVMQTQLIKDDLQSFLSEAQTIARLVHPHIVRVLEFGVEGTTPFLVMDYALNGTLRNRHPRGTRVPLPDIVSYVKQVADALQFAHNERLIHRDIKPENMLVGRYNNILLSDFGIALVAQSSRYQNTQDVIGTAAYMAPEQIQGKPRPASDQYALGVVVYEWLSGYRPFQGSFTEIAIQHVMAPPPSLQQKFPDISPAIEQVVFTAIAKDPHHRFTNIQSFANALEQASTSVPSPSIVDDAPTAPSTNPPRPTSPIALTPTSPAPPTLPAPPSQPLTPSQVPERSQQFLSRRTVLMGLAGLALAGGGGVAWFAFSQRGQTLISAPTNDNGSRGSSITSNTSTTNNISLTVGGKLDTEAQLLTEMYSLLLKKVGFPVVEKRALGTNAVVFAAITSGQIDLYPEFTATGLAKLGKSSSNNPDQDYQTVKQGYETNYHITWLDKSPLNDTYGICTTHSKASSLGVTKISDLASKASSLTIATPPDGKQYGVEVVKSVYNITFKGVTTYNEEGLTFPAVMKGAQDLNICYTTAALIAKDNFVLLQDDKNAFPAYNPAPIVRDATLQKAPGIATALNPLAPKLTTEVSQQLQAKVVDGQSVTQVATDFLKSQGLL